MRLRVILISILALILAFALWYYWLRPNFSAFNFKFGSGNDVTTSMTGASDQDFEASQAKPVSLTVSGDVDAGREVFAAKCAICHSVVAGQKSTGPTLVGIFGQPAASADPKFAYSQMLKDSRKIWDPASLEAFLADPGGFITGTTMLTSAIPDGAPDGTQRVALVAYLATLK